MTGVRNRLDQAVGKKVVGMPHRGFSVLLLPTDWIRILVKNAASLLKIRCLAGRVAGHHDLCDFIRLVQ